jgi:hypothetical protein
VRIEFERQSNYDKILKNVIDKIISLLKERKKKGLGFFEKIVPLHIDI